MLLHNLVSADFLKQEVGLLRIYANDTPYLCFLLSNVNDSIVRRHLHSECVAGRYYACVINQSHGFNGPNHDMMRENCVEFLCILHCKGDVSDGGKMTHLPAEPQKTCDTPPSYAKLCVCKQFKIKQSILKLLISENVFVSWCLTELVSFFFSFHFFCKNCWSRLLSLTSSAYSSCYRCLRCSLFLHLARIFALIAIILGISLQLLAPVVRKRIHTQKVQPLLPI